MFLLVLFVNAFALADEKPVGDAKVPMRLSQSTQYRCGENPHGIYHDYNGVFIPFRASAISLTCHDDQLWAYGYALRVPDFKTLSIYKDLKIKNP